MSGSSSGAAAARRWRALVVDDEPPARSLLSAMVADSPALAPAGECADGEEAVAAIRERRPDLVFLDVQMPGLTGFDVIARVGAARMPLVIFVTAYDAYALRAFDAHVFDYLLKPVEPARFDDAVARAAARLASDARAAEASTSAGDAGQQQLARRLEELVRDVRAAARVGERIPVRTAGAGGGRAVLLRPAEIDRVESEGNYLHVRAGAQTFVVREPLAEFQARLPPSQFARLNRSVLVNLDRVREVQPWFRGDYVVILADGERVVTGKTYRAEVRRLFGLE